MVNYAIGRGWEPKDPQNNDFRFKLSDDSSFDPDDWPSAPDAYRPTSHFTQRFNNINRVLTGDIINDAITSNQLVPALNDCAAFYTTKPGVVYYIVVGWDRTSPSPQERGDRVVVTGWPWLYDREEALDSGRFSSRILNRIQEINNTLFTEETADDDWLEYFEFTTQTATTR